jgi:hypothetical protein
MPCLARVVLPHYPHHVVQRGHNKQLVFAEDADDRYDLDMLATFKALLDAKVYAFCLACRVRLARRRFLLRRLGIDPRGTGGGVSGLDAKPDPEGRVIRETLQRGHSHHFSDGEVNLT